MEGELVTAHMRMTNPDGEKYAKHASCIYICSLYMSQYLRIHSSLKETIQDPIPLGCNQQTHNSKDLHSSEKSLGKPKLQKLTVTFSG